ncbi:MAG: hypothetical protein KIS96_00235 [Bauldia sp.]|nr:hypothetical protein [Bauldia sp.]
MMQLMVGDLDQWWRHIEALDLPAAFGVATPKPPTLQPWGLRIRRAGQEEPHFVVCPLGQLEDASCARTSFPRQVVERLVEIPEG